MREGAPDVDGGSNGNGSSNGSGSGIHSEDEDRIFRLKQLFSDYRGSCPVYLIFRKSGGSGRPGDRAIIHAGQENYVRPVPELFEAVEALCGKNSIAVNRMGRMG
jgi:hypothetical protein